MTNWLVPRDRLSVQQLAAVEASHRRHHVMVGGPGSGKTLVLLHRARFLWDTLGCEPGLFRVLVYTRVLKSYVEDALRTIGIPDSCVSTVDGLARELYQGAIGSLGALHRQRNRRCGRKVNVKGAETNTD